MRTANKSCMPLAHDNASPYQFWSQNVLQLRRHHPDEHAQEFLTFSVTLTLTTTEQSNVSTIQLLVCHKTKFSCKRISSSEDKRLYSDYMILPVTMTLKTTNQSFWKTIWLTMMQHHTSFGSKRFNISEDTIWTNIHWHFEIKLCPWPWTQESNFSIRHSGLWYWYYAYDTTYKPSM